MPTKSKVKAEKKPEPKAKAPAKTKAQPVAAKPAAKAAAKPAPKPEPKSEPKSETKSKPAVTLTKLREMAKELAVKGAAKMDRQELIHAIQVAEGHAACYSRIPDCGQMDCLFRPDCLPEMGLQI
jgi:hypothetical protein